MTSLSTNSLTNPSTGNRLLTTKRKGSKQVWRSTGTVTEPICLLTTLAIEQTIGRHSNYVNKNSYIHVYIRTYIYMHTHTRVYMKIHYPMQAGWCCKMYLFRPLHYCTCLRLTCKCIIIHREKLAFHTIVFHH